MCAHVLRVSAEKWRNKLLADRAHLEGRGERDATEGGGFKVSVLGLGGEEVIEG